MKRSTLFYESPQSRLFSILSYFSQTKSPDKTVKGELDEELLSLLNLPKIDLKKSDLRSDLSKCLNDDCITIDRWLENREKAQILKYETLRVYHLNYQKNCVDDLAIMSGSHLDKGNL